MRTNETVSTPGQSAGRKRRRPLRMIVRIMFVSYLAWFGLVYFAQSRLLYQREVAGKAMMSVPAKEGEEVWLTAADGVRVEAWFLPGAGRSARSPGPAVIYTHGNAELIENNLDRARFYAAHGVSVLMPEYRGYGRSGGEPSESAIAADMEAFYDLLVQRPEVDRARVFLHGRSLGGGVAAELAQRKKPAGLILESTFTSVAGFAWKFGVPPVLVRNPYRTDARIGSLGCPILILHGADDEAIPAAHGRALHALAGSRYYEGPGGHNDFPRDRDEYEGVVLEFVERVTK